MKITKEYIKKVSKIKNEPEWMLNFRLKSFDKFKELFYRYTGIKPGTPITEEDIRKNRFGAFNRIAIYNGCTDEELVEALLK